MNEINSKLMAVIVDAELTRLENNASIDERIKTSWRTATRKAQTKLATCAHRTVDSRLVIASDSGEVYATNANDCQCKAYTEPVKAGAQPKPCWHRAAAILRAQYDKAARIVFREA